jgi:hypothetical protein
VSKEREMQEFDRSFLDEERPWTWIGPGEAGGKAQGLMHINNILGKAAEAGAFSGVEVAIPRFVVVRTGVFDAFLDRNGLRDLALSGEPDDVIAAAFVRASLPAEMLGDLRSLAEQIRTPLAIRSSSLLEDALFRPFAGVYVTKMIPNNAPGPDARFRALADAIKLVYASTFFRTAREYIVTAGQSPGDEKMGVVIQEVVGQRHGDRFYPHVAGVARSYNFYSFGRARPEQGVVSLALGLGKTIVDGGRCYTYSPAFPMLRPPTGSVREFVDQTQSAFWAVNMGQVREYDPTKEGEYLTECSLRDAEEDGTLRYIGSTYDVQADRLTPGVMRDGARAVTFDGLLGSDAGPVNDVIKAMLQTASQATGHPVEIEFAMTLDPLRFGFLQVRPMVVSEETVEISDGDLQHPDLLVACDHALGNGVVQSVSDVVYLVPDRFEMKYSQRIAAEVERINGILLRSRRPYVLMGFGRWGSADPWLGVPVNWSQVSAAKVIVEATLPGMSIDVSQGSHFFHNLTSFRVGYFCLTGEEQYRIRWNMLGSATTEHEADFLRHVRLPAPLDIRIDGRSGRGIIRVVNSTREH